MQLVSEVAREQSLLRVLAEVRQEYDYVLIDCQPSLGLLTVNALTAAQGVIIPLECEFFSLRGVALLVDTIDKVKERLNPSLEIDGILATMYDSRTVHAREVFSRVVEAFGDTVFQTVITRTVRFPETTVAGQPITTWASTSVGCRRPTATSPRRCWPCDSTPCPARRERAVLPAHRRRGRHRLRGPGLAAALAGGRRGQPVAARQRLAADLGAGAAGRGRRPCHVAAADPRRRRSPRRAAPPCVRCPAAPARRTRVKHEEKITVYCSAEELLALETARLTLRGDHGVVADRGRIVREAIAVLLADLDAHGENSVLVRNLAK